MLPSLVLESGQPQIKVPADVLPREGPLPGLEMAIFWLRPHLGLWAKASILFFLFCFLHSWGSQTGPCTQRGGTLQEDPALGLLQEYLLLSGWHKPKDNPSSLR